PELVREYATIFFLTAVARLASEKSRQLRQMLTLFLANLVRKRVDGTTKRQLLDLMLHYPKKVPKIVPAMAEVLGLFAVDVGTAGLALRNMATFLDATPSMAVSALSSSSSSSSSTAAYFTSKVQYSVCLGF
ncbi:unnamed protein product, partial [Amoebophrya sp. A25]